MGATSVYAVRPARTVELRIGRHGHAVRQGTERSQRLSAELAGCKRDGRTSRAGPATGHSNARRCHAPAGTSRYLSAVYAQPTRISGYELRPMKYTPPRTTIA